jgi:hypoxanthine phosphoribosyltransferase
MEADIARILLTSDQIRTRVHALAGEISAVYGELAAGLTIVPILSGSIIFLADLIRELPLRMKIAVVHVSTYPGPATEAATPRTVVQVSADLSGRHVLLLDDILDTGRTLRHVRGMIAQQQPASVRTAVLLRKPSKAPADLAVEFVGFDVEDLFVVGYGLDFDDHYRNYPHIGVLRPGAS